MVRINEQTAVKNSEVNLGITMENITYFKLNGKSFIMMSPTCELYLEFFSSEIPCICFFFFLTLINLYKEYDDDLLSVRFEYQ